MQADATEKTFKDFYLSDEMQKALERIEYFKPTPVQRDTIPLSLAGIDLIVQSQTGTGKTAAFGIPIVEMLDPDPSSGVQVLVLAPTRELAKQVSVEFERLAHFKNATATSIYGGAAYEPQIEALKSAQIVCATPGRLLDLLKQGKADLSGLRFFILDEADEMLSMGFERELNEILGFLPEERQSLLFSATVTEDIKALARNMLFYPEFLSFSSDSVINKDVTHTYTRVDGVSRTRDLLKLIEFEDPENAIIFANTKSDTFLVTRFLKRHGFRATVLNGDLPQSEREKTLKQLREGKIDLLVATDVAARGIDISDLTHVFNYMLPEDPDVYVHRTGRTGRAGKKGRALSIISPAELATFIQVKKRTGLDIIDLPLPSTHEIVEAKRSRLGKRILERLDVANVDGSKYLGSAREILAREPSAEELELLIARLITLAADARKAPAPAPVVEAAPAPAPEPAPAPVTEPEPKVEAEDTKTLPEPDTEEVEEVVEDEARAEATKDAPETEEKSRRRRRRRGGRSRRSESRDSETEERSEEEPRKEEPRKEEREERRSRRSRRGRRSESKPEEKKPAKRSTPKPAPRPKPQHDMGRLQMTFKKNAFEDVDALRSCLVYMSGMDDEDFGSIDLTGGKAVVEARQDFLYDIAEALNNQEWNGIKLTARAGRR